MSDRLTLCTGRITAALPAAGNSDEKRIEVGPGPLPEEFRARARTAKATGKPLRFTIQATGPMRDWLRIGDDASASMTAKAPGKPTFGRQHDGAGFFTSATPIEEGVIEAARVLGPEVIEQDVAISGHDALDSFVMGINPGWSFHAMPTRTSQVLCSCGEPWSWGHAYDEEHYPGEFDENDELVTLTLVGDWDYVETTRTYMPRGQDTRITSYPAMASAGLDTFTARIESERAAFVRAREAKAMAGTKKDEKPQAQASGEPGQAQPGQADTADTDARILALQAEVAEMKARDAAREAEFATIRADSERRQNDEIRATVIGFAAQGKLHQLANTADPKDPNSGLNQELAVAKAMGLERYKAHMARVPANPALAATIKTPAPGQPPGDIEAEAASSEFADRMIAMRKAHPNATAEQISQMAAAELAAEGRPVTLH